MQLACLLATPIALLLLPIALTLWFRHGALRGIETDRAAVWSSYRRMNRFIVLASLAGWWALWDLNRTLGFLSTLLRFLPRPFSQADGQTMLFWVLPLVSLGAGQILFYCVDRAIGELRWRRIEILRQGWWSVVRYVIPVLMTATGFDAIFKGESAGIFWIVGAALVAALGKARLDRAEGLTWHQLTSGELRNRAFAMARRMGTKLRSVYIVPEGKGHLTNAFARALNSIALTDNLPKYLTKREVDCVIAHELAHVKGRHVRKLLLVLVLTFSAMIVVLFRLPPRILPFRPLLDLGVILVPVSIFYFFSRRFEYAADREAVVLMGDPESAIRALAKLHRIRRVPTQWSKLSEAFLTHPSLMRRAQAIARIGQIPAALAVKLLQGAD